MQFHPNEVFLYYDPTTNKGKQTKAYASTITKNINAIDSTKVKLTATLWKEIVNMLDIKPKSLLDKSRKDYQQLVKGNAFTMTGWLDFLAKNPQMLKAPIAIYHNRAIIVNSPTDILKLDQKKKTSKVPPHLRSA